MFTDNNSFILQVHGGAGNGSGGLVEFLDGFLDYLEKLLTLDMGELYVNLMPGLAELPNLHPLAVHFPIALLSVYLLLDITGSLFKQPNWRRAAGWFLYIGALSAWITIAAGWQAEDSVAHSEVVHSIIEKHEMFGVTVGSLAVFLSIWRILAGGLIQAFANIVYLLLSIIMVTAMVFGADLGGLMVYHYGVGVDVQLNVDRTGINAHQHIHHH